jgi:hypothetical protein
MNEFDKRLSAALRSLAETSPQMPPPSVGTNLRNEFRRYRVQHRRQQVSRMVTVAGCCVACLGLVITFKVFARHAANSVAHQPTPGELASRRIAGADSPAETQISRSRAATPASTHSKPVQAHATGPRTRKPVEATSVFASGDMFIVLPTFDPAIPIEQMQVVRLEMPGRALRLVGFPITEEVAQQRILADVAVAQDGTPYAVRLVQSTQRRNENE